MDVILTPQPKFDFNNQQELLNYGRPPVATPGSLLIPSPGAKTWVNEKKPGEGQTLMLVRLGSSSGETHQLGLMAVDKNSAGLMVGNSLPRNSNAITTAIEKFEKQPNVNGFESYHVKTVSGSRYSAIFMSN